EERRRAALRPSAPRNGARGGSVRRTETERGLFVKREDYTEHLPLRRSLVQAGGGCIPTLPLKAPSVTTRAVHPLCKATETMADKSEKTRARLPRGFVDRPADDIRAVEKMTARIREVFELYGFEPVEQPLIEYTDALGR